MKKFIKIFFIGLLGVALGFVYSYILHQDFSFETIFVFVVFYAYLIFFMKFLVKLFK